MAVVLEDYLQWLPAFAATSRRPGSKLCSPLLLAARHASCYNLSPALLTKDTSAGTICRRRCYNLSSALLQSFPVNTASGPALLQYAGGDATIGRRRCYNRSPALLQYAVDAATKGHRRCYNMPLAMLQSVPSSALLQSVHRWCCFRHHRRCFNPSPSALSGPALLLSAPRRFLRPLLRAEPGVTTSSVGLQPSAPDVCYYGRHELLRAAYQRETGMLQRCRQSSPAMVGQRSHGERRLLQWQAMNATMVDIVCSDHACRLLRWGLDGDLAGAGWRPRRSWSAGRGSWPS